MLNFTGTSSKAESEASRTEEKKGAENGSESKSIYLVLANNYVQIEASHLSKVTNKRKYLLVILCITFRNAQITYQRVWHSFLPIQQVFVGSIKQPMAKKYKSGQWL